jgi:hypothetical protein
MSDAPKVTMLALICLMPPPDGLAWRQPAWLSLQHLESHFFKSVLSRDVALGVKRTRHQLAVLIKGSVRVTRRDPLGHRAPIVEQGPGEFVAEVGQLSVQPAFVDVHAIDDVEALLTPKIARPDDQRARTRRTDDRTYDVAVVGAGPAGLSTAVYAAWDILF